MRMAAGCHRGFLCSVRLHCGAEVITHRCALSAPQGVNVMSNCREINVR